MIECNDKPFVTRELVIQQNGRYSTIGYDQADVDVKSGGSSVLVPLEVSKNGIYRPEGSIDGYNEVTVNVPDKPEQEKTADIQSNGSQTVVPDEGYALSKVTVNVNVPDPELEELSVTVNGTYTPDKYGYSKVEVAVPQQVADLYGFDEIGYTGSEEPMKSGVAYAKQIKQNWDPSRTDYTSAYEMNREILYFPVVDTSNVTNFDHMFANSTVVAIPHLDTSNVTNMNAIFHECKLTEIPDWDYSKVQDMTLAFKYNPIKVIPDMNFSEVTSLHGTFAGVHSVSIGRIYAPKCTDCAILFSEAQSETVGLLEFPSLENAEGMFAHNSMLTAVNMTVGDNIQNMKEMFYDCYSLKELPEFNMSNVNTIQGAFKGCSSLETIRSFNGLGTSFEPSYGPIVIYLADSGSLTNQSVQNIIDTVADLSNTVYALQNKIQLNSGVFANVTGEQIRQAEAKGWTIETP